MAKFERLRALLAHHGSLTYAQLFDRLADQELKRIDPMRKIKHKQDGALRDSAQKLESETKSETALNAKVDNNSESAAANAAETPRKHRPHIPLAERREVYQRAGGKCEYVDPKTGRRCNSEWALQIDHIQAYGRGGEHGLKNFRLVCCSHNRFLAEKTYGSKFMSRYLRAKSCGEQN
jgi:5-methylcytosine-specific restriction endonuclease McrA